jgi:hypothetical protein
MSDRDNTYLRAQGGNGSSGRQDDSRWGEAVILDEDENLILGIEGLGRTFPDSAVSVCKFDIPTGCHPSADWHHVSKQVLMTDGRPKGCVIEIHMKRLGSDDAADLGAELFATTFSPPARVR